MRPYEIVFTDSDSFAMLGDNIRSLGFAGRRVMIVADTNTAPLYLQAVSSALSDCTEHIFSAVIPAGEEHKTLEYMNVLYREMITRSMDRNDLVVALGGGVIGDMAGYLAATYLRGVSFVQIPTTLLAMTDSSIGGKTGVDLDGYKNMIGAFHMPRLIYTNTATLSTLNEREFACGMAEVVKHALIRDREFGSWLIDNRERIKGRERAVLDNMIRRSSAIKLEIVDSDPGEKGERRLLNYGHTIGHAIEKASGFRLTHGECVSLGSVAAAYIGRDKALLTDSDVSFIKDMFRAFALPASFADISDKSLDFDADELVGICRLDKKADGGRIHFVLLDGIGSSFVSADVDDDLIKKAIGKLS